jgi:hypothetical protein
MTLPLTYNAHSFSSMLKFTKWRQNAGENVKMTRGPDVAPVIDNNKVLNNRWLLNRVNPNDTQFASTVVAQDGNT